MRIFSTNPSSGGAAGSSGIASNSFTIIQPDSGTSPTASSTTDTLTLHSSDASVSISGNSATKTINFTTLGGATNITQLTGDGTATGPGSVPFTLATVNPSVGSFGSATLIPIFTANGKGLLTFAGTTSIIGVTTMGAILASGAVAFTGNQSLGSHKLTNVTDPTSAQDAATKNYVDTVAAGINPAVAVQAATTSASDTSGYTYSNGAAGIGALLTSNSNNVALTVDGFTFTALNQRLLVKNDTQSPSGAFNGIYYVTQLQSAILPVILTRALDYDQPSDINNTGAIPVINGTVNGTTQWVETALVNTVGTDPLTFARFSRNPADYLLVANNLSDVASAASSINNILPSQVSNSGKFLTTDGSAASWGTPTDTGITQLTGDVTAGPGSGSQASTLATVNSNTGKFGSATLIPIITVNGKGLVTALGTTTVIGITAITGLSGDATASGPGVAALTLATVNSNVGTFGSATLSPIFTVNAKGLVTFAGTTGIYGGYSGILAAYSAGVTTAPTTGTGNTVALSASPTFTGTVNVAALTASGKITAGAATTSASSINIPSGTAPTSPNVGDIWSTGPLLQSYVGTTLNTHSISMTDYPVLGLPLTGSKFIRVSGASLATGNSDLYTVPSGKRAMFLVALAYQSSGSSITLFPEIKVSSTYYRVGSSTTVTSGTSSSMSAATAGGIILEAGEILAVNTTAAGLSVWYNVVEFDNTSPVKTVKLLGLSSGNQTLYTVPSNNTAIFVRSNGGSGGWGDVNTICIGTNGATPTLSANLVNSGGSVSATNQVGPATVMGGNTKNTTFGLSTLNSGDFVNINSNGADATTITWLNVFELQSQ